MDVYQQWSFRNKIPLPQRTLQEIVRVRVRIPKHRLCHFECRGRQILIYELTTILARACTRHRTQQPNAPPETSHRLADPYSAPPLSPRACSLTDVERIAVACPEAAPAPPSGGPRTVHRAGPPHSIRRTAQGLRTARTSDAALSCIQPRARK